MIAHLTRGFAGLRRRPLAISAVLVAVAASGALIVQATAGATTPNVFRITPTSLAFGYVPVGSTTAQQTITITNVSSVAQVMSGAGGGAGVYGGVQDCQGTTLQPHKTCHMFYAFSPTATGSQPSSTSGTWNGQSFKINFTGFGTPQFLITPLSLVFGGVKVGTTSPEQAIVVKNLANKPVVMSGAGGGAGVFGGVQNCQGETLAAGTACHMFYAFSPTATGTVTSSTSGTWNGQAFKINLSGTGTP